MSLRVAYLVSRFPKLSETFIVDEILALERRGVAVDVYALRPGRDAVTQPDAAALATRAHTLPLLSLRVLGAQAQWLLRSPGRFVATWARVLAAHARSGRAGVRAVFATAHAAAFALALQRDGVERIHAHWATHTALAAWVIHRLTGLPYSFTAHADDIFVPRPMLETKVRDANAVVTISEYNRAFLLERLGAENADRLRVIHCGVRTDAFEPAPPVVSDRLELSCVARLEAKKGHADLLEACALLAERGLPFRCRLVGEGPERPALERRIAALGLGDRVELLGAQPRDRVRAILAESQVGVMACIVTPSGRADGIPVALMEAMAMARPVVATRVSGLPELIEHERGGLLVEPADPRGLADALERLHADPALAGRLGEGARKRVLEAFDVDRNAAELHALFGAATARAAAPAPAARLATTGSAATALEDARG